MKRDFSVLKRLLNKTDEAYYFIKLQDPLKRIFDVVINTEVK